tara:strand:+ start:918 stop:1115 length:198 start_codon:yes stop_codon:yes gene_type:complete
MKNIKKYLIKEEYKLVRQKRHLVFKNLKIQKTITVSHSPKNEFQELRLVKLLVRRYKREYERQVA